MVEFATIDWIGSHWSSVMRKEEGVILKIHCLGVGCGQMLPGRNCLFRTPWFSELVRLLKLLEVLYDSQFLKPLRAIAVVSGGQVTVSVSCRWPCRSIWALIQAILQWRIADLEAECVPESTCWLISCRPFCRTLCVWSRLTLWKWWVESRESGCLGELRRLHQELMKIILNTCLNGEGQLLSAQDWLQILSRSQSMKLSIWAFFHRIFHNCSDSIAVLGCRT